MYLPSNFKQIIADHFYDKSIDVIDKTVTTDTEGGVIKMGTTTKSTFNANVRVTALNEVQQELGLVETIDIAITCDPSTEVSVDDLLQYAGRQYVATDVIPYDSYKMIVGRKWL